MSTTPTGPPATPRSSGAPAAVAGSPQRYAVWLGWALTAASECLVSGDVPVGAVVLDAGGQVIGTGWNVREAEGDPTGHAEVVALRDAARHTGSWRLSGCTLAVTLEPCPMCACGSVWDLARDRAATHHVEVVGGVREGECAQLITDFFAGHRL